MYTSFYLGLGLINNMDHIRNSGTEPSSMILRQTKYFKKLKSDANKVPKQAKTKWDGVINIIIWYVIL